MGVSGLYSYRGRLMDREPGVTGQVLERFRAYLLAGSVPPAPGSAREARRLRHGAANTAASLSGPGRLPWAERGRAGRLAATDPAHNLAHTVRDLSRVRRDIARERSLDWPWMPPPPIWTPGWRRPTSPRPASTPSSTRKSLRLAEALERLPEAQTRGPGAAALAQLVPRRDR